jgi:pimeloyl-ACP methyl ester carboxylesterase
MKLWPVPYESMDATTHYGRTHVISCGPKDAAPLVLLHGGYASSTMCSPNVADLADKLHVLALVTIGEPGRSVPTQQDATKGDLAAWLVRVLDELGISQTQIVGLSRGGWLALNLAVYAPQRLRKIGLLSPAASFGDGRLIGLSLINLLFVTLYPVAASIVGAHPLEPLAIVPLSANSLLYCLSAWAVWSRAAADRRLLAEDSGPRELQKIARIMLLVAIGLLLAIPLAFLSVYTAYAVWILCAPIAASWVRGR